MKPAQRLKKVSTTTKVLISGNGQAYLDEIEDHLDRFLDDARAFDAAVWDAVMESKGRLFKIVQVLSPDGKKDNAPWRRLKDAWGSMAQSGADLASVVRDRAKKVQARAKP